MSRSLSRLYLDLFELSSIAEVREMLFELDCFQDLPHYVAVFIPITWIMSQRAPTVPHSEKTFKADSFCVYGRDQAVEHCCCWYWYSKHLLYFNFHRAHAQEFQNQHRYFFKATTTAIRFNPIRSPLYLRDCQSVASCSLRSRKIFGPSPRLKVYKCPYESKFTAYPQLQAYHLTDQWLFNPRFVSARFLV